MSSRLRADLALEGTKLRLWAQGAHMEGYCRRGRIFTEEDQVAAPHLG